MRPNTRVVYLESPGSLTFEVQDFPAIAKVARERGAAVIHDNTWATGMFFRSFDHGADLVDPGGDQVSRGPLGPADRRGGRERGVVAAAARHLARPRARHASPDDLFLALRGMRTLDVRLQQHEASALADRAVAARRIRR